MKTYQVILITLSGLLLITCYHRAEHFDDAWFAEQSYWLVKDGKVRSELFRGFNGWEERIYVFHKLYIYTSGLVMSLLGFSLTASKLLTTLCAIFAGYLIWHYNSRASKEHQWLSAALYIGCGTIIRYFSVNRPEIMCMMLGFGSYLALDRPNGKPSMSVIGGLLAGLAGLTHLNGLIYLIAGVIWLLAKSKWKLAILFSLTGAVTLSLYGLDALADGHFNVMVGQFINDPATQANFSVSDKIKIMVNYHQLFFHSHGEVPLTSLVLLCLLLFRRHRSALFTSALLYLTLLIITFWALTKSNFDFYYILFVPWLVLVATNSLITVLPKQPQWQKRMMQAMVVGYFSFSLFSIGKVLVENYQTPYVPTYNNYLAQHMPQRQTKIIAPISFFFEQMDHYKIHGLSYYSAKHSLATLEEFFRLADRGNFKYVVSDAYLTAGYVVPLNAPVRIGSYKRIFHDNMTSIYERK